MNGQYDVIIIGTGAGGGTLAHTLASSGKRILLLERGDWLPREPENWSTAEVFVNNRYISPDTWTDERGKAFQPQIHYFVGGATKLYGAALYRLRAEDFGELQPPRRPVAGLAHLLRADGALLHPGRTALPGPWGARRGPDRTAGQRALPVPAGQPRTAHPAALRRPRRGRLPPVPRAVRHHARTRRTWPFSACVRCPNVRRLSVPGAGQVRCRGHRGPARRSNTPMWSCSPTPRPSGWRPTPPAPR